VVDIGSNSGVNTVADPPIIEANFKSSGIKAEGVSFGTEACAERPGNFRIINQLKNDEDKLVAGFVIFTNNILRLFLHNLYSYVSIPVVDLTSLTIMH
jgi:hypothetical protein